MNLQRMVVNQMILNSPERESELAEIPELGTPAIRGNRSRVSSLIGRRRPPAYRTR